MKAFEHQFDLAHVMDVLASEVLVARRSVRWGKAQVSHVDENVMHGALETDPAVLAVAEEPASQIEKWGYRLMLEAVDKIDAGHVRRVDLGRVGQIVGVEDEGPLDRLRQQRP